MENRLNFTKAALTALPIPSPGNRAVYHDTKTRLNLRITSTGVKTFCVFCRLKGGQPQRISIGRFPETTVEQARAKALGLLARIANGEDPAGERRRAKQAAIAEMTLGQAFDLYYADYLVPEGKRTASAIRNDFDRYIGDVAPGQKLRHGRERKKAQGAVNWERRKLSTITPSDVRRMMISLREGAGARTSNKALVLLKAIYNKVIAWKLFNGPNPCVDESIRKFADGEQSRTRYLLADEIPRFFETLQGMDRTFQDFVRLLLTTAARRENVLGMRWQDINLDARLWTIGAAQSKNREPMTIPLTDTALQILRERRSHVGDKATYVFPAKSKTGYMTAPKKKWHAFLREAGITDLHIHDLRRTLATYQINTGASVAVVGRSLGHRSVDATMVYARFDVNAVRNAMDRATCEILSKV